MASFHPLLLSIFAPSSPSQPIIVQLPANNPWLTWVPVGLSFLQFVLLGLLTYYIFADNARQEVAERRASWYHKIVVDYCVPVMATFFSEQSDQLCRSCIDLHGIRAAGREDAADQLITASLGHFKEALHSMAADVGGRLSFFDETLARVFLERVDKLQDDVAHWFDTSKKAQPYEQRESLPRKLVDCHNDLIRKLNSFEFEKWGWPIRKN